MTAILVLAKYGLSVAAGALIGVLWGKHNPTPAAAVAKAASVEGQALAAQIKKAV